jgi:MAF protein
MKGMCDLLQKEVKSFSLVLASGSPRRRQLLTLLGLDFIVRPVEIDETPHRGEPAAAYVLRLARAKARACRDNGSPVLAADTAVVDGQTILGKPRHAREAAAMLRRLRGRGHQVYTAIALRLGERLWTDLCVTDVVMRDYDEAEIEAYLASGDALDKAGAYAIQHPGFRPVAAWDGCYASVIGLPLCTLTRLFGQAGFTLPLDVAARCQEAFDFHCAVYPPVLSEKTPSPFADDNSSLSSAHLQTKR